MGSRDLVRFESRGVHRTVRRRRCRNSLIVLLFLSGHVAEVGPDFRRQLVLDRARVRSLVGDADLHKVVKDRLAFDFELPSQIINSNLTAHLFIGLPAIKHVFSNRVPCDDAFPTRPATLRARPDIAFHQPLELRGPSRKRPRARRLAKEFQSSNGKWSIL
jgi:hypothetical protein